MRVSKFVIVAAVAALPLGAAHAQSPMTMTPIAGANQDNYKDTSSKAKREAEAKKAAEARKAHKPADAKKAPDANAPR